MTPCKQGGSSLMVWLKADNGEIFSFSVMLGLTGENDLCISQNKNFILQPVSLDDK